MRFKKEKIRQIIQEEIIKVVREEVENEVRDAQEAYGMLKKSMDYLDKGEMASVRQALESIEIYFDNELASGEFSLDEEMSDECRQAAETLRNCMKSGSGRPKSTETELGIMKEPIAVTPGKSAMGVKFVNEDEESIATEDEADIIQDQILRQMRAALEQGLEDLYKKHGISAGFEERDADALYLRRQIEREIENKLHDMTMAYVRHGENSDD